MKKISLFLLLSFFALKISAQAPEIDSLTKLLKTEIPDTVRVEILRKLSFYGQSFRLGVDYATEGLDLARKINFENGEAACLYQLGNCYMSISNFSIALHYFIESLKVRERVKDINGIAKSNHGIGTIYYEQGDYKKALSYYEKSLLMESIDNYRLATFYQDFGDCYSRLNLSDSALVYYQRSYEKFNLTTDKYQLNVTLSGLGNMQNKMGNAELALGYFRQALRNGVAYNDTLNLSFTNLEIAKLFDAAGQQDSSIFYAGQSLFYAQKGTVLKNVIASGNLLSKLYKNKDDKSALHYLEISQAANDSLFSREKSMQIQNMFFTESQRETELAEKAKKDWEDRKQNIEYALIALGIITFVILFLLLSRSIIVNEKMISFFGILGLLVVFEFINLFIHPFLEKVTHHNLVLMLLVLVAVASLLIPLHHRMEKWIKEKMVLKNKRIRLDNAKKTIEQLEEKVVDTMQNSTNA
jgi:tetratricopeptide (TPR) repeat protein